MSKEYLGDSVYAEIQHGAVTGDDGSTCQIIGYEIRLTTENGLPNDPSNTIWMDKEVFMRLCKFAMNEHFVRGLNLCQLD